MGNIVRAKPVRLGLIAAIPVLIWGATGLVGSATATHTPSGLHQEGVGIYTDASTAFQLSTFTINPRMVSCGVGTLGFPAGKTLGLPMGTRLPNVLSGGSTGPFAMMMYSESIDSYTVAGGEVRATGKMRSITKVGGLTVENVVHDFLAVGKDNGSGSGEANGDNFATHFTTPFWNPSSPMCSPSDETPGWCMFGGNVLIGEVTTAGDAG